MDRAMTSAPIGGKLWHSLLCVCVWVHSIRLLREQICSVCDHGSEHVTKHKHGTRVKGGVVSFILHLPQNVRRTASLTHFRQVFVALFVLSCSFCARWS